MPLRIPLYFLKDLWISWRNPLASLRRDSIDGHMDSIELVRDIIPSISLSIALVDLKGSIVV